MITDRYQFFVIKYLFSSKRALIYSSIGLILILTLVISSALYTTAQFDVQYKNELYRFKNNLNGVEDRTFYDGYETRQVYHESLGIGNQYSFDSIQNSILIDIESVKNNLKNEINLFMKEKNIEDYISYVEVNLFITEFWTFIQNEKFVFDPFINVSESIERVRKDIIILELNPYYKEFLFLKGIKIELNETNEVAQLVMGPDKIIPTSQLDIYNYSSNFTYIKQKSFTIVENFVVPDTFLPKYQNSQERPIILLVNNIMNLVSELGQPVEVVINPVMLAKVENLNSDDFLKLVNKINSDDFNYEIEKINLKELDFETVYIVDKQNIIINEVMTFYDIYNERILSQLNVNVFIIFPFMIIGIFITNYSFNLVSSPLEQKLKIFKMRGISKTLLVSILISESILIFSISTFLSIIFSYIFVYVGLQTEEFLSINIGFFPFIRFNFAIISSILLYLIIIFILISIPRIISKYRKFLPHKLTQSTNEDPFWKNHYIDLWLILIPAIFIIFYLAFSHYLSNPTEMNLLTYLVLIFPFILVIGLFLSTTRLIEKILENLSIIFKKTSFFNIRMSISLLTGMNKTLLRGFLIITLLIFLTNSFLIISHTMESDVIMKEYSVQGFDLIIEPDSNPSKADELIQNSFISLLFDQYKEYITEPLTIWRYYLNTDPYFNIENSNNIMIYVMNFSRSIDLLSKNINPVKISPGNSINEVIENVTEIKDHLSILAHRGSLEAFHLKLGELPSSDAFEFKVTGTFDYYPGIAKRGNTDINPMPVIVDESNLNILIEMEKAGIVQKRSEIYVFNFKTDNYEKNLQLSQEILNQKFENKFDFTSISLKLNSFKTNPSYVILWGEILIIFAMTFIMLLIVIMLFMGHFYNQLKEILFIEKALGANYFQIFKQIWLATIIFVITSILIGNFYTGILFQLIFFITSKNPYINITNIYIPYNLIFMIYSIIILFSIVLTFIYAKKINKIKIIEGLENE